MVVNRELERIPKEVITTYCYGVTPDSGEDTGIKKTIKINYKIRIQRIEPGTSHVLITSRHSRF